ncbi:MAG: acyltransferase [Acidobacteria bacterium]|nr:acyltransferase [Acidobacteriota bacterium]
MKSKPQDYLPTLDGWRGVALCMLLFAHVRLPGQALQGLALYGGVSVHIFFALSGFLITQRLLDEHRRTGGISLRAFYIRRVFRILPAALTYLAFLSILGFGFKLIPLTVGQIVAGACFYRNYWVEPADVSWYTGHYWSLSVEEHFYLIWPGLLALMGIRRGRWMTPLLAVMFAVWRGLDMHYGWLASINPGWRNLVGRTDYRMDGLFWGCAMAFLWDWAPAREWLRTRGRAEWAIPAWIAIVLCLYFEPPGYLALFAFLLPIPLVFTTARPDGRFGRFFEGRFISWFGRLSYSVYIWQMLFLPAYGIPISLGWLQWAPLNLFMAVGCACASYYFIEKPFRRIGVRLAASKGAPAQA